MLKINNRRGPTSIYDHKLLLKSEGVIIGIHPLYAIDIFDECTLIFDTIMDFAEHLSSSHMSKEYRLSENKEELDKLVLEHTFNNKLLIKEERFIVQAK